jgi:Holliday junction resolvasome RuvABC DNA-binding subunit
MNIIEALENALTALESLGYKSGDIHDDLALAIGRLKSASSANSGLKSILTKEL